MRVLLSFLVAASLSATAAQAEPLSPGRPAGVRPAARMTGWQEFTLIGTGAAILAAVGILASKNSSVVNSEHFDSNAVPFQPTTITTTTTS